MESTARMALRMLGRYRQAYWLDSRARRWRERLERVPAVQAVVVNDFAGLPLAFVAAGGAPVVFDAHEHWTSESVSWNWRTRLSMRGAHEWICDGFVPATAGVMTVSDGIATDYQRRTGVTPQLVTNAPYLMPLTPSPVTEPIRLVHIGMADERRRIEDTIDAVRLLSGRFTLDVVLAGNLAYRKRLERYVADDPNIRILPPVPADDLISLLNPYDIGVFLLPGDSLNFVYVLPNKLFDYLQARLAVAIGPSREMARVLREWDCGVVSPSFEPQDFAKTLNALSVSDVERMKRNANRAAQVLTADANRETVIGLVAHAIAANGAQGSRARAETWS
jgi:hypothetical protein